MVLGTAELKHRKSTVWPTTRERATIVSYETQHFETRNSKWAGTEEKCRAMDKLAQEGHSVYPESSI